MTQLPCSKDPSGCCANRPLGAKGGSSDSGVDVSGVVRARSRGAHTKTEMYRGALVA